MLAAMARNRFTVQALMPFLVVAVLALGGLAAWLVVHGPPRSPWDTPHRVAERQVREQRAGWEVRYFEAGSGPIVCGYAAPRSRNGDTHEPVAFVSSLGRVLFADDPLSAEFRDLKQRHCPGFAQSPPNPR